MREMSLALAYTQTPSKRAVNALIIAHYDAHGVSFAGARARILRSRGEEVEIVAKFPETGPQGLFSGSLKNLINVAPQRIEVIDIPIDVRNPDASIKTLADLATIAPIYYYDHHETDVPFIPRLHQHGIFASVFGDNVAMAIALELLNDSVAKEMAIVGMVADRDPSVLKLVSKEMVEQHYLPLANRLDVIVRQPQLVGVSTPGEFAKKWMSGEVMITQFANVQYPPELLAREISSRVIDEGSIAILVDWSDQPFQHSQWTPKTLEQLLLIRRKHVAIAVVPGYNPRTRAIEGYDVRVLRYWLSPSDVPIPEDVVKDLIAQRAITGNVVGHADYVSIRFSTLEEARNVARVIFNRIEGMQPTTAHLISDRFVAEAVRRDYRTIIDLLERIARALERGAEAKEQQVELLRDLYQRDSRTRYD